MEKEEKIAFEYAVFLLEVFLEKELNQTLSIYNWIRKGEVNISGLENPIRKCLKAYVENENRKSENAGNLCRQEEVNENNVKEFIRSIQEEVNPIFRTDSYSFYLEIGPSFMKSSISSKIHKIIEMKKV